MVGIYREKETLCKPLNTIWNKLADTRLLKHWILNNHKHLRVPRGMAINLNVETLPIGLVMVSVLKFFLSFWGGGYIRGT